jgi:5'-3' exonuclease
MNEPRLVEEFGIHPANFALARAMAGDKSDNLVGVKGVGLGTISKRLPFFADKNSVTIPALIEFCENNNTGLKAFSSICDSKEIIEENYKIMQLYAPSMSYDDKSRVKYIIDNFDPEFNKTEVIKRMEEDGFGNWDTSDLFTTFKRISSKA